MVIILFIKNTIDQNEGKRLSICIEDKRSSTLICKKFLKINSTVSTKLSRQFNGGSIIFSTNDAETTT